MQSWWVTANLHTEDHDWHWDRFFKAPKKRRNFLWGCGEIDSTISLQHIEEMEEWDIVVAYQATEKNIYGFAYLGRGGFRFRTRSGGKDSFELGRTDCELTGRPFVRLTCLIPLSYIQSLYNAENNFAFVRNPLGTVFNISPIGFKSIVAKAIKANPDQAEEINSFISWVRNKGLIVDLDQIRKARRKKTAEVFTPPKLVKEMLDKLPVEAWEPEKTFLDPACGNGNFLAECLRRKLDRGHPPFEALSTIYGVDLMPDNVLECQKRLLAMMPSITADEIKVVLTNIVCADSLAYDFEFDRTPTLEEIAAFRTESAE